MKIGFGALGEGYTDKCLDMHKASKPNYKRSGDRVLGERHQWRNLVDIELRSLSS
jgi:hypothetical protein